MVTNFVFIVWIKEQCIAELSIVTQFNSIHLVFYSERGPPTLTTVFMRSFIVLGYFTGTLPT